MIQHRVKHLEPVHIGYINKTKYALVTEDGSKFYPNDLAYHKSIETMIQQLDEKDEELVHLWSIVSPIPGDPSKKGVFYLNEKEVDDYCKESLNFLETSNSQASYFAKIATMEDVRQDEFYNWSRLEYYFTQLPAKFIGSIEDKKIRSNWKKRAAPNGKGVYGRELARTMVMLKLSGMNMTRATEEMSNLNEYQSLNQGRKVILRMMKDKGVESYDDWKVCSSEVSEACSLILEEEGRLKAKTQILQAWRKTGRRFTTVKDFEKFLEELGINKNRFVLVPDVASIRQSTEPTAAPKPSVSQEPSKKVQRMKKSDKEKTKVDQVEAKPTEKCEVTKKVDETETGGIFERLFGFNPTTLLSSGSGEVQPIEEPKKTQLPKVYKLESKVSKSKKIQTVPEVAKVQKECPSCEKERELKDENDNLKRQLAEKSKSLEDRENRVQSDGMRLHEMQRKLEEANKLIAQHEETIKGMEKSSRTQANKIKEDSKREIQELKEKLGVKDKCIKQLEMELKESRENAKNEQKKKNSKEDNEMKIADKAMKKMKAELEMAKLTEKTNSKKIDKLEKDNRDLQIQLELLKEQIVTSSKDSQRIEELIKECDDLKLENIGILANIEEVSMKNSELEKFQLENHVLMIEIDRLKKLSLKSAPFTQLQNQQENKENSGEGASSSLQNPENQSGSIRLCLICTHKIENGYQNVPQCEECRTDYHNHCLSMWLGVNPNCPHCRVHWPDPQQFPAL